MLPERAPHSRRIGKKRSGLGEGTYSVEASAPSFTTSRRAGLKLSAGASQHVSLTLNVGELAQSITVEGTVSVAAETSPPQNTLEARSQNFASPADDILTLLPARSVSVTMTFGYAPEAW